MKVETNDIKCIFRLHFGSSKDLRRGDFFWVDEYQAHIWQGKTFAVEEYNKIAREIVNKYQDYTAPEQVFPQIILPEPKNRDSLAKARAVKAMKRQEELRLKEAQKGSTISDSTGTTGRPLKEDMD